MIGDLPANRCHEARDDLASPAVPPMRLLDAKENGIGVLHHLSRQLKQLWFHESILSTDYTDYLQRHRQRQSTHHASAAHTESPCARLCREQDSKVPSPAANNLPADLSSPR